MTGEGGAVALEVTVLGAGTLVPDDDHRSAAHWIQGDGFHLLLDCGSGTVHGAARHGVPWDQLTHLALTHFHTDHIGDVAPLLWALRHGCHPPREEPLIVLGPPGVRHLLKKLDSAFGDFVLDPGFPVEVHELPRRGRWSDPRGRFTLETHPTPHTEHSVGYRVEGPAGDVGFTGDTGPSAELAGFFSGVQLLLAECSIPDPTDLDNHLSPRSLATLALQAEPELLVVTHCYPELERDGLPDLLHRLGYTGEARVARDGLRLRVDRRASHGP